MKRANKSLNLKQKIDLLEKIKLYPGKSLRQLSISLEIPVTTLSRIRGNESALRKEWDGQNPGKNLERLRRRTGKSPLVEEALTKWFTTMEARNVSISGPILKQKAINFAESLDTDFLPTDGWLARWKMKNSIKYKRAHGEKASADKVSADAWISSVWPKLLEQFSPNDVYNADETGLYYRATPDGSLCFNSKQLVGHKKSMQRLTVLLCCNMSGTDKRNLLVIGKSAKPRCFRGINNLPVVYKANKQAWMTSEIFKTWLEDWDRQLTRPILLIVDNCTAHPKLDGLKFIRLEFIPPNTTSIIQPLDMGIIKNLKTFYRKKLVQYIIREIEEKNINSKDPAQVIGSRISMLKAINFVSESWGDVTVNTIANCFGHAGFAIPSNDFQDIEVLEEPMSDFECYVDFDMNISCYDGNENVDESIVQSVKPTVEVSSDDDEEEIVEESINFAEAKDMLEKVQSLFMRFPNSPLNEIRNCINFVNLEQSKHLKQAVINDFFKGD